MRTFLLLASPHLLLLADAAPNLQIQVNPDGQFNVTYDGKLWLNSGEYSVGGFSYSKGEIVTNGEPKTSSGSDALGAYKALTLSWTHARQPHKVLMQTSFRTYPNLLDHCTGTLGSLHPWRIICIMLNRGHNDLVTGLPGLLQSMA